MSSDQAIGMGPGRTFSISASYVGTGHASRVAFAQIPLKKSWVWRGFGWITGPEVDDVFVFAGGL
jgi:hypothetical protein